jgi:hypothetical protein
MRQQLIVYVPSLLGVVLALGLWVVLSKRLALRNRSRWRAVLLCLPLVVGAFGYGLFWFGFFLSPERAVQMHAIRLTLQHFGAPFLPWIVGVWLLLSGRLLLPALKRT